MERAREPDIFDRLQQVGDRVRLEGFEGIVVVRRGKDNDRQVNGADRACNLQAGHPRHLDIQEDQIRLDLSDGRYRITPRNTFPLHRELRMATEPAPDASACQWLVVNDQDAIGHWLADRWRGMFMITVRPAEDPVRKWNTNSSP